MEIIEIDEIQDKNSFAVTYTMQSAGIGTYDEGELVYQGNSLETAAAIAYVANWNLPNRQLKLRNIKGAFSPNLLITGVTSNAKWTMLSGNTQEDSNSLYDDNFRVESEADDILDWTEINPFGSPDE
jgi:hypothetical protein